jgi:hypothetical protein
MKNASDAISRKLSDSGEKKANTWQITIAISKSFLNMRIIRNVVFRQNHKVRTTIGGLLESFRRRMEFVKTPTGFTRRRRMEFVKQAAQKDFTRMEANRIREHPIKVRI